jgi:hypothetical protein
MTVVAPDFRRMVRDALDRAGLAAKNAVEVEVGPPKPYQVILEAIEAGSRAEYRRSISRNRGIGIEDNTTLVDHPSALTTADVDHVVDDFMVDDDALGMAYPSSCSCEIGSAPKEISTKEKDEIDDYQYGTRPTERGHHT